MTNQDIAKALAIGMPTVKFHVTNIFGKLGVDNRVDAVLSALRRKLVPPV
jgi:NarL family two-component system response regulator LiaR